MSQRVIKKIKFQDYGSKPKYEQESFGFKSKENSNEEEDEEEEEKESHVIETKKLQMTKDSQGQRINEYQILENLGRGSYGKVKKAVKNGKTYAIKIMNKRLLKKKRQGRRKTALDNVRREIAIMKKVNHPNVVNLYEVIDDNETQLLFLVMEFMEGGALMDDNTIQEPIEEPQARKYFRDIICGLDYLHFHQIVHRDIKPENLLKDKDGKVKIADFGVSDIFEKDDKFTSTAGTPAFLPPEICSGKKNFSGKDQDIWAVGISLYYMVFGMLPFLARNPLKLFEKIQNEKLTIPEKTETDLKSLILGILEKDPDNRMKIDEIYTHPWVTERNRNAFPRGEYTEFDLSETDIQNAFTPRNKLAECVHQLILFNRWNNDYESQVSSNEKENEKIQVKEKETQKEKEKKMENGNNKNEKENNTDLDLENSTIWEDLGDTEDWEEVDF
ncbi:map/microtubule affinity-regulating kinase [Anaeramoeba flamelloides]|uniref:Map/microtubule affinity-regulating kinase n=1 Tax=Anaeramoeba flamelloides TaxID=1746091 RepID=A0AAV7ZY33_9EUKA|nr:map/microtubule affinity-regulating kinase [Anaeramoeba flamelloides]